MITRVGNYELNNSVEKTAGLKEYTDDEYALFALAGHSRMLSKEKIFHGTPVEFNNFTWKVIIGANNGLIFNIGLLITSLEVEDINKVFKSTLEYLIQKAGRFSTHPFMSKKYSWELREGNMGIDMQKKMGRKAITLFLTSISIGDEVNKAVPGGTQKDDIESIPLAKEKSISGLWLEYIGVENTKKILKEKGEKLGDLLVEHVASHCRDEFRTRLQEYADDQETDLDTWSKLSSIDENVWKLIYLEFLIFYLYIICRSSIKSLGIKKGEYFGDQLRLRVAVAFGFVDGVPQRYSDSDKQTQLLMKLFNERAQLYDKTNDPLGLREDSKSENSTLHVFGRNLSMILLGVEKTDIILTAKSVALLYFLPLEIPQLLTGQRSEGK